MDKGWGFLGVNGCDDKNLGFERKGAWFRCGLPTS